MNPLDFESLMFVTLLVLCTLFWIFAIAKLARRQPLLSWSFRRLAPWRAEDVLLGLAAFLLLPGMALAIAGDSPSHIRLLFATLGQLLAVAMVSIVLWARYRPTGYLPPSDLLGRNLLVGIVAFVAWVPVILTLQRLLTHWFVYEHTTISMLQDSVAEDRLQIALITFFSAAICAPLVEEFFFRWVLQGWLQKLWFQFILKQGDLDNDNKQRPTCWLAIIVCALLFALLHGGQGPAPIPLFFLAIGIGYVFDRTGSLISCIVIHFLLNAMTMSLLIWDLYNQG